MNKEFALIGASRAGVSLAYHLVKKGYRPAYCWNRNVKKYSLIRKYIEFDRFLGSLEKVEIPPRIVIIAVSDDAIKKIASRIALSWRKLDGVTAFHISGTLSSDVLSLLAEKGANTGSLHPFVSIPDIETGIKRIPDTIFTCEGEVASFLQGIAKEIGKDGIIVTARQKAFLHVTAVFLSNYVVTMVSEIKDVLEKEGLTRVDLENLLLPMVKEAGGTALKRKFIEAITGPIVRQDEETIKKHLQLLSGNKRLKELYKVFGKITCEKIVDSGQENHLHSLFEAVKG